MSREHWLDFDFPVMVYLTLLGILLILLGIILAVHASSARHREQEKTQDFNSN